jgi:hypothetical protein
MNVHLTAGFGLLILSLGFCTCILKWNLPVIFFSQLLFYDFGIMLFLPHRTHWGMFLFSLLWVNLG